MLEQYKGRVIEKNDYWAFEYKNAEAEWCELIIRSTKEQLLEEINTQLLDLDGNPKKNEDGETLTVISPFWYEED